MGVWEMARAWRDSGLTGNTKMVLMSVAEQANDEGLAHVRISWTARKVPCSLRSVQRSLRELCDAGHLALVAQPVDGKSAWTYQLGVTYCHPSVRTARGDTMSPEGVTKTTRIKGSVITPGVKPPLTPPSRGGDGENLTATPPPQKRPALSDKVLEREERDRRRNVVEASNAGLRDYAKFPVEAWENNLPHITVPSRLKARR